jgi:hypothetical protein
MILVGCRIPEKGAQDDLLWGTNSGYLNPTPTARSGRYNLESPGYFPDTREFRSLQHCLLRGMPRRHILIAEKGQDGKLLYLDHSAHSASYMVDWEARCKNCKGCLCLRRAE